MHEADRVDEVNKNQHMKGNCKPLRVLGPHFVISELTSSPPVSRNMPGLTGNPIPGDGFSSLDCLNQVGLKPSTKPTFGYTHFHFYPSRLSTPPC